MLNEHVVSLNMIIVGDISKSPNLHEFEHLTMRLLGVKFLYMYRDVVYERKWIEESIYVRACSPGVL